MKLYQWCHNHLAKITSMTFYYKNCCNFFYPLLHSAWRRFAFSLVAWNCERVVHYFIRVPGYMIWSIPWESTVYFNLTGMLAAWRLSYFARDFASLILSINRTVGVTISLARPIICFKFECIFLMINNCLTTHDRDYIGHGSHWRKYIFNVPVAIVVC